DDVGSWLALERHIKPDAAGNHCDGAFVGKGTTGCIVDSDSGLVAALGVKDLVIVRSGDAVFVADRSRLDSIKALLALIAANKKLARHL
ncbi:MAG: mannose-1-phosphate guanylyltransferase/mannose-6-phosphate isomerase, partial [bacterium]